MSFYNPVDVLCQINKFPRKQSHTPLAAGSRKRPMPALLYCYFNGSKYPASLDLRFD